MTDAPRYSREVDDDGKPVEIDTDIELVDDLDAPAGWPAFNREAGDRQHDDAPQGPPTE